MSRIINRKIVFIFLIHGKGIYEFATKYQPYFNVYDDDNKRFFHVLGIPKMKKGFMSRCKSINPYFCTVFAMFLLPLSAFLLCSSIFLLYFPMFPLYSLVFPLLFGRGRVSLFSPWLDINIVGKIDSFDVRKEVSELQKLAC